MISPEDIKILHLPLAWWKRDELHLGQLEIKLFQVYNIYCSPWGWLGMWATHICWNGTGEDSRASTSALYLWVSSEKLYWIHILHPCLWRIQLTFTIFLFSCFSNQFYTCMYIHIYIYMVYRGDFGKNSSKYGKAVGVSHLTYGGNMELQPWVQVQRGWSGSDPSTCCSIMLPSSKGELQSACLAQRRPAKAAFTSGSTPRCAAFSI